MENMRSFTPERYAQEIIRSLKTLRWRSNRFQISKYFASQQQQQSKNPKKKTFFYFHYTHFKFFFVVLFSTLLSELPSGNEITQLVT